MKEVNCFNGAKIELGEKVVRREIKIFNEKTQSWREDLCIESETECPVCKTPIIARYLPMSWANWCCSKECIDKYHKAKEDGTLLELLGVKKN